MASVKAFCGLRYNQKLVDNALTVAPPYDVIGPQEQEALYQQNPYNIIRLELGKKYPDDTDKNNRYSRAAADFKAWQDAGILLRDDKPSFYLYAQEYSFADRSVRRLGFLATIRAEGYQSGSVLPHEETLPKHKADRLELMRHTFANFSPIFGLFSDKDKVIDQALCAAAADPVVDFTDAAGVRQTLWQIDDEATCSLVEAELAAKNIYIADGHHRYETASLFAQQCREQGIAGCDYLLIALVNLYDEGLLVFPTHRLVKSLSGLSADGLLQKLQAAGFTLTPYDDFSAAKQAMADGGKAVPSFLLRLPGKFYLLQLQDKAAALAHLQPDKSAAYRNLDVSILHSLIMEDIFGIGPKQLAEEGFIAYTRIDDEAKALVDDGSYACSFMMNSTLVEELIAVAKAGEKMPQKSTYFYPKFISGLVINKLK